MFITSSVPEAAAAPAYEFVQDHYLIHTIDNRHVVTSDGTNAGSQFITIFTTSTSRLYICFSLNYLLQSATRKFICWRFVFSESNQKNNSSIVTLGHGLQPKNRSFQILWQLKGLKGPRTHSCPRCWKKTLLQHHFVLSASPVPYAEKTPRGQIGWFLQFFKKLAKKQAVTVSKMQMEIIKSSKDDIDWYTVYIKNYLRSIIVPNEVYDITLHPYAVHFHPKFMHLKKLSGSNHEKFSSTITLTTIWL